MNKDSIRAIRYGASGKLFVSAGDMTSSSRFGLQSLGIALTPCELVTTRLHDFLLFSETSSYMIIMMADLLRRELVRLL